MRRLSIFVRIIFIPLLAGCSLISPEQPPTERVIAQQWSSDASTLYVCREKPYDSAGFTYLRYYIEQYNQQGTLLNSILSTLGSTGASQPAGPVYFTPDCQHVLFSSASGIVISRFSDTAVHSVLPWPRLLTVSPSAHLILCDTENVSGSEGDGNVTFALMWIEGGTARQVQKWKTHGCESASYNILNDTMFSIGENIGGHSYFSVYDTLLTLLYREPMPPLGMQGLGYVPSTQSILAVRNWNGPGGKVVMIDLATGRSQRALDWTGPTMNAAPDGFHVVYDSGATRVRNLLTGDEKDVSCDFAMNPRFSPDGLCVSYLTGDGHRVVRCAAVNGLP